MGQSYSEAAPSGVVAPPRMRPVWVWVIALVTWYAAIYNTLTETRMMLGFTPIPVSLQRYVTGLTHFDHVLTLGLSGMACVAATLLWLLRRQAVWWYLVTFFLGGADFARHVATRGLAGAFNSLGAIGFVLACIVFVAKPLVTTAILAYVISLYRRGTLE